MSSSVITLLSIILAVEVWTLIVLILERFGVLKKLNLSRIWYIVLMWRTERGKGLIDRIAGPKKFWTKASTAGFILFFLGMVIMFIMMVLSAWYSIRSSDVDPVGADEIFVLPGVNPYVPFIYGLIGLIVAVVVHEFSHGIITRAMDFKVRSLGILFMIVPIGAFMEPDEKQVDKGPRLSRMRIFASGPLMNFVVAFLFIGLFSFAFMGSVEAEGDPIIVMDISEVSPLHLSLDEHPEAIYSLNGTSLGSQDEMGRIEGFDPGNWAFLEVRIDGERALVPVMAGVMVIGVGDDTPAERSGLKEGSIIYALNGTKVMNSSALKDLLSDTKPDQVIILEVLEPLTRANGRIVLSGDPPEPMMTSNRTDLVSVYEGLGKYPVYERKAFNITLADKHDVYPFSEYKGKGYIGITSSYLGVSGRGSEEFMNDLSRPIRSGEGFSGKMGNIIYMTFVLPLELSIMPFHSPLTDIYEINGPLSVLPDGVFWFIANTVFYIFWLNILLGLFNALPMVPLDGGFVFKDAMVLILKKFMKNTKEKKLEKIAKKISTTASFIVLGLILVTVFFPWIRAIFF